ncbi:hypothetical protein FKM82_024262 [Ascaphus truei]
MCFFILGYPLPPEVCLPFFLKEEDEECFFTMDENGNFQETKLNMSDNHGQQSAERAVPKPEDRIATCERDWDNSIDDSCILEATEDVELADAVDNSLINWDCEDTEIPDELLLEAVNEHDTSVQK